MAARRWISRSQAIPRTGALACWIGFAFLTVAGPAHAGPAWYAVPPMAGPGQPIALTFSNTTTSPLWLANSAPWRIENSSGAVVRSGGPALQAFFPVPPGGCWVWGWDQKDDNGTQVSSGTYLAKIAWSDESGGPPSGEASFPIVILGGVLWQAAPDPVSQGTTLGLTLTNATTEEISLDNTAPWQITDESGAVVYVPANAPTIQTIPAGSSRQWFWDLRDQLGTPCPAGQYLAEVSYRDSSRTHRMEAVDPFTIVPAPAGAVVWEVTPPVQSTRSLVLLTLTNATPDTIWLRNSAPWSVHDATGNYVSSASIALQAIWPVPPGATAAWSWDERYAANNDFVPAGEYEARVSYAATRDASDLIQLSRRFRLVALDCEFVSSDRYFYGTGETVPFRFTNCAADTVAMPCSQAWWISTLWGQPVYWPYVFWAWTFWEPTAGFDFSWPDQEMYNDEPAPPGEYLAWAYFTDERMLTRYTVSSRPITILNLPPADAPEGAPATTELGIHPNPPRPSATVRFVLPIRSADVALSIADASGRIIATRPLGALEAGPHAVAWPERDDAGRRISAGVYFCQLRTNGGTAVEKVVIAR